MTLEQRITAFHNLGFFLHTITEDKFQNIAVRAKNENPWFTQENIRMAITGISKFLNRELLQQWVSSYHFNKTPQTIALVMAGNIPLVGFHDFLSVLIAGHNALIKVSSKDSALIKFIAENLLRIEPAFKEKIVFAEQLKNFNAVIATGSDNSSRYFEYYFAKYPHIIRKNRTSVAILDEDESNEELDALATDVFSYFGLGCRNVSKLFVPEGYSFDKLLQCWEKYSSIIHHHKYCNNYDYQKSILLINRVPFLDNGFVLLQENEKLVSPITVLYFEYYKQLKDLKDRILQDEKKIQCIVGKHKPATVPFGQAQCPSLNDYADNIDTLKFLSGLD